MLPTLLNRVPSDTWMNEIFLYLQIFVMSTRRPKKEKNLMFSQKKKTSSEVPVAQNEWKNALEMQGEMLTHRKTSSDCWLQWGQEAYNRGSIEKISLEHWEFPTEWSVEVIKKANRTIVVSCSLGHPCNIYRIARCSIEYGAVRMLWQLLPKCAALGQHTQ